MTPLASCFQFILAPPESTCFTSPKRRVRASAGSVLPVCFHGSLWLDTEGSVPTLCTGSRLSCLLPIVHRLIYSQVAALTLRPGIKPRPAWAVTHLLLLCVVNLLPPTLWSTCTLWWPTIPSSELGDFGLGVRNLFQDDVGHRLSVT